MLFLCKFGQNPKFKKKKMSADKAHFYSLNSLVTLKIGSRSQKSNTFFYLTEWYNTSAPDNIRTAINYGSGSSKYGLIVKTASTEYGRFLVGTVQLFR